MCNDPIPGLWQVAFGFIIQSVSGILKSYYFAKRYAKLISIKERRGFALKEFTYMLIQVAKALGAEVAATVRDDNKAEFAKKIGADMVINTRKEDFVQQIKDWTGGLGADVVIDNLSGDILAKSIETTKPRGVIVAYGFAAGPQVSFDIRQLFFTEKKLLGSMASEKGIIMALFGIYGKHTTKACPWNNIETAKILLKLAQSDFEFPARYPRSNLRLSLPPY